MSKIYNRLPSEIIKIKDEYTAYCFDEACCYIRNKLDNGEQPSFRVKYKSFSDLYKKYN